MQASMVNQAKVWNAFTALQQGSTFSLRQPCVEP